MYTVIDRVPLKARAKELIKSAKVSPIKMALLYSVLTLAMTAALAIGIGAVVISSGLKKDAPVIPILFFAILISLVDMVLSAGLACYHLGVWRGEKMPYSSLFDGFSFAGKIIGLQLVSSLFVFLWSLLFIIPGIVASYRYSFALYNLCLNPELDVLEALELSKQQTNGYKLQLFTLDLSFFGWLLLADLPSSIAGTIMQPVSGGAIAFSSARIVIALVLYLISVVLSLFVTPYYALTHVGFYLQATMPLADNTPDSTDLPPAPPEV